MRDLLPIKEAVYEMSLYFNQAPGDERITAYAKALSNYTPKQIIFAFKKVIGDGSAFFPSLAEILKHLKPLESKKEDQAPILAKEILKLIRLYGPMDELNMLEAASEDARLVILALGSTSDLRNSPQENIGTTMAQLERLAKGVLASKDNSEKNAVLESIGINTGKNIGLNRQSLKVLDFSSYLPGASHD